jgi:hypothetical protein
MAIEVYEKWLEYYDDNGLSWLATQVQASIKQAFFAGYEAAEQNMHLTGGIHPLVEFLSDPDKFSAPEQNLVPPTRK